MLEVVDPRRSSSERDEGRPCSVSAAPRACALLVDPSAAHHGTPNSAAHPSRTQRPGQLGSEAPGNDMNARRTTATEILRLFTASRLPATSQDRNFTVAVALTMNGPVYVGLLSVGVVPLVV